MPASLKVRVARRRTTSAFAPLKLWSAAASWHRQRLEVCVREYRRGFKDGIWQKLWHFEETCPNFPRRAFLIRNVKPSEDELCSRCDAAARRS